MRNSLCIFLPGVLLLAAFALFSNASPQALATSYSTNVHATVHTSLDTPSEGHLYGKGFRRGYKKGYRDGLHLCSEQQPGGESDPNLRPAILVSKKAILAQSFDPGSDLTDYDRGYKDGYPQGFNTGLQSCSPSNVPSFR